MVSLAGGVLDLKKDSVAWWRATWEEAGGKNKKTDEALSGASKKGHIGLSTKWKLGAFWNEVTSDPVGVGFAFGGVEPGRLHAKGKCVDVHKLYYSIGRAGKYKLHIGLRHQMAPLPGSPFALEVHCSSRPRAPHPLPPIGLVL